MLILMVTESACITQYQRGYVFITYWDDDYNLVQLDLCLLPNIYDAMRGQPSRNSTRATARAYELSEDTIILEEGELREKVFVMKSESSSDIRLKINGPIGARSFDIVTVYFNPQYDAAIRNKLEDAGIDI